MTDKKDVILWGALACALVGTAHAEYTLGMATGGHWLVAGSVVGALDLYVVRALQVRKDVLVAVLVMVAANVASRLVHADVLPVGWPLYSAVGALAPFLLWRIQYLKRTRPEYTDLVTDTVRVPDDKPYPDYEEYPVLTTDTADDTDWDRDYLPEGWTKETVLTADTPQVNPVPEPSAPVLPPLPPGYAPSTETNPEWFAEDVPDTVDDRDVLAWPTLVVYLDTCREESSTPTIRGLMSFGSMGQDKAKRLLVAAGVKDS